VYFSDSDVIITQFIFDDFESPLFDASQALSRKASRALLLPPCGQRHGALFLNRINPEFELAT